MFQLVSAAEVNKAYVSYPGGVSMCLRFPFCHCVWAHAMTLIEILGHYHRWVARGESEDWNYSNSFVVVCAVLLENIAANEREGECHLTFHAATSMHHDYMLVALQGKVVKAKVSFLFREVQRLPDTTVRNYCCCVLQALGQ
uniref:N19B2.015 protein n=1 Tax=Trypanosoma brucei TaxID=5691 RepID=Q8WPR0_9TRYP|nr:N19B2.015 [Trypanosoma brucei]